MELEAQLNFNFAKNNFMFYQRLDSRNFTSENI